jgi:hypothetical protein
MGAGLPETEVGYSPVAQDTSTEYAIGSAVISALLAWIRHTPISGHCSMGNGGMALLATIMAVSGGMGVSLMLPS